MRRKLMDETTPARRKYMASNWSCQVCVSRRASDCHEITRGAYREKALRHRAAWLAVCRECHEELGDYRAWPITRQLAVKLLADPWHFDLAVVNEIRSDREPIELAEVTKWLRLK
jgi:hypothetical protein